MEFENVMIVILIILFGIMLVEMILNKGFYFYQLEDYNTCKNFGLTKYGKDLGYERCIDYSTNPPTCYYLKNGELLKCQ